MSQSDPVVEDQGEIVARLADPACHGGAPVERIETHGAFVFLAGDRAFKMKRAVRFPFMDFSTRAKRRAAAVREVELNRRTAPALYLGLAPVWRAADGGIALGAVGEEREDALEWLVVMRRFPADALLDQVAAEGRLDQATALRLAEVAARFHREAEPRLGDDAAADVRAVALESLEELEAASGDPFPHETVERLGALTRQALDRTAALIDARGRAGKVRRCHGDLHLRNVVLLDGEPVLFDALEFDEALATTDVLYDLAFLLMDLDHRGLHAHANAALNRWLEETGDWEGLPALRLFLSMRAAIRAKVGRAAAAMQQDPAEAKRRSGEAAAYLDLALAYLEPAPPRVVAVGGLSGTGKSTLARALAPALGPPPGAIGLRSDVIRKQLAGVAPTERLPPDSYTPEAADAVHARMHALLPPIVEGGLAIVADAVFAREAERDAIEQAARAAGASFTGLWLEAGRETLIERVGSRTGDASDASAAVVRLQAAFDLGTIRWTRLDAGHGPEETLRAAKAALGVG